MVIPISALLLNAVLVAIPVVTLLLNTMLVGITIFINLSPGFRSTDTKVPPEFPKCPIRILAKPLLNLLVTNLCKGLEVCKVGRMYEAVSCLGEIWEPFDGIGPRNLLCLHIRNILEPLPLL